MISTPALLMFLIILTFTFHIIMLAIEIVLSLIIPLLVYLGRGPHKYFKGLIAKRYMHYIAISYSSQQIFLTAATVFTLSFFPEIFVLLGNGLFYSLLIFVIIYALRLFALALYWYGWNTLSEKTHHMVGTFFAFSGLVVLYLDSVILSYLSYPVGLVSADPPKFDYIANFVSPLTTPLFLLLMMLSVTTTLTILGFIHAQRVIRSQSLELGKDDVLGRLYLKIASIVGMLILPTLVWYSMALYEYSYYKFSNMFGFLVKSQGNDISMLVLFALFSYTIYLISSNRWNANMENYHSLEHLTRDKSYYLYAQLVTIGVTTILIFLANLISQSPYFLSDPQLVSDIPYLNINDGVNAHAGLDIFAIGIFALIPLLIVFFSLLYMFFTGIIGDEREIENKKLAGIIVKYK